MAGSARELAELLGLGSPATVTRRQQCWLHGQYRGSSEDRVELP